MRAWLFRSGVCAEYADDGQFVLHCKEKSWRIKVSRLTAWGSMSDGGGRHQTGSYASQLRSFQDGSNRATIRCGADPAVVRLVTRGQGGTSGSRIGDETIGRMRADQTANLEQSQ